ncbi:MAG: transcription antitermination factor NusB [Bryobacteraceae bacterium]
MAAVAPARDVTFRVLQHVSTGAFASDALRQACAPLDARDAALAESIVFGCLRFQAQLDFLIGHYSGKPRQKLDDEVRIALRMGIYQLRYLERIPPHAAVTESVELVKKAGKRSASGFVNAILRKVNRSAVSWPDRATELSIPAWMLGHWEQAYGTSAAEGIAKAALIEPESSLNETTERHQDIGAQSIVPLLEIESGMSVLDLCAAPGNKTAQAIAAGGRVVAADRVWKRLISVPAEAARVVLDAALPLPFRSTFDRILVDAPCSGTGTLARNPEIKWRLTPENLPRYQARQHAILKNALACLAPGGRLVYSTCSLEREENETVVAGCAVQKVSLRLPGRDAGDGFFAAVITP